MGSYLRLTDFVCHSTLGVRVIKKKKDGGLAADERGGNNLNGFKTFALNMAQDKARIWP